jgi:hypothetical protein
MAVTDWIERLGRAIFESPFGSGEISRESPELAEIRLEVLREVKSRTHRVSGREIFANNLVRIRMRGVPAEHADLFKGKFFAEFFEQELRAGLAKSRIRFPQDLAVEMETDASLPTAGEQWLDIQVGSRPAAQPVVAPIRPARIVVVKGSANHADVTLIKARTNIGRTSDVYRSDGPSRRNDLAFDEVSEISKTVSREHAHIMYSKKTGEYRLFNDRAYDASQKSASCGLWILRDGISYEVHRSARGTKLDSGDEIHLGRAVLRFVNK